jgi:hypothetical protein
MLVSAMYRRVPAICGHRSAGTGGTEGDQRHRTGDGVELAELHPCSLLRESGVLPRTKLQRGHTDAIAATWRT